jgi:MFS transporter, ACS family, solute carrier family 17 (sodium-dependent inorganic phosphate cotransporter), other
MGRGVTAAPAASRPQPACSATRNGSRYQPPIGGVVLARAAKLTAARSRVNAAAVVTRWPRRHVVVALIALGVVIAYTDRVNISVAAVAMKEHFGWTQTEKGFVLAAFFVGYLSFMFVAGLLANRFGGKRVVAYSVLAWSIFTLLTPPAAASSIGVLIAARFAMGISETGMYPGAYELVGRWVLQTERGRAVAIISSGSLGTVIGLMGSGWLVQRYGWAMPFYVFGTVGLVWLVLWLQQVEDDPATDPRLCAEERALLSTVRPTTDLVEPVPLRRLLLRAPVAGIVAGHVASNWSLYVLLSWLPSYFRDVQGLSIAHSGLFSAAPWLTMYVTGILAGSVADRMIQRGVSATTTRKVMQCGALIVSAGFLLALREAHSPTEALTLLCGATGALACYHAGLLPIYVDVAPRHGAVLFAFGNSFATVPGIVGVAVTGWLVDTTGTYSAAFLLTAIVSAAGALAFGILADARPIVD